MPKKLAPWPRPRLRADGATNEILAFKDWERNRTMFKNTKLTTLVMIVLAVMATVVATVGIYNARELRHADDSDTILFEHQPA